MQIITGKYRARKLQPVPSEKTRPTLARVKESIFNLIQFNVPESVVLDLFAGSGAFGAECVSRGAKKVYFVDSEPLAIKTVYENTRGMTEDFEVIKSDFTSALDDFKRKNEKFDIIYLDPPYKSDYALVSMNLIEKYNLLSENGIIIVEHEYENDLQNVPSCFIMEKQRKYGIAYVTIFKKQG